MSREAQDLWNFLGLFALVLLVLLLCTGCATGNSKQRDWAGECQLPPDTHEGATWLVCDESNRNICCVYKHEAKNCHYVVCAEDCGPWQLAGSQCL